jgi:osmoprotectant transport system ATP-binding protein
LVRKVTFELSRVSKRYGNQTVLQALDLRFETGKTYVVIGPSGCGKSTLLRLMVGLVRADSGALRVGGEILSSENLLQLRRRVGYVIQDGGLFPHLSAADNVALMARFLGWPQARLGSRLRELAELTHFPLAALERYPAQLSGGQRQRVGLMRALMLDPELLLLDEPLCALDPMIRTELQCDLRDVFHRLKKTVVMVTHDLHEAAYFAHEVILLARGRLVQRGKIDELIERPAEPFVTRFVNSQRRSVLLWDR